MCYKRLQSSSTDTNGLLLMHALRPSDVYLFKLGIDISALDMQAVRTVEQPSQQIALVRKWVGLDNYQELPLGEDPFRALHSCPRS